MATKVLDITKEHCPMTFVKTKIELSKLQPGDILEVLLSEGEPLDNVPRNAKEQGYNVLSVEHVISIRVLGGFPFPRSQLLFVAYCNESFVTFYIPFIKIMLYICKQY